MNKKKANKKIKIVLTGSIILIILLCVFISITRNKKDKNIAIIAIKTVRENEQEAEIKYTIGIKDYNIENIKKEILYENKENAQIEYDRIQIINKYEQKGIQAELKKKKLTLIIPEDVFLEEIEYNKKDNIKMIVSSGETIQIINQDAVVQALQNQGYTIK